ncbi:MAG TPA: phage minor head protein [Candidatus Paceibacterota bacterium]
MKLCGCSLHKANSKVTNVGKYVAKHEDELAAKIERVLTEHGKRIAKAAAKLYVNKMLKVESTDAIVAAILADLNVTGLSVSIVDELTPELISAFNAAGVVGIGQVGIGATGDMVAHLDKAALSWADDHGAELAKGLTATTEAALRSVIGEAVISGSSAAELSKMIQAMGGFGKARAMTIARTELATAHVQGNVQGWRETGMVEGKEWIMGDLHDTEDECDRNASLGAIDLDTEYENGVLFPPAHPNCVCDVLPVLKGE